MRKMVPAFSLPGHTKFNDAVSAGRSMSLRAPRHRTRRRGGAAIHRRHDGRGQGRDAAASHDRRQPARLRGVDAARSEAQAAHRPDHHRLRAAALSRLRLHHLRPAGHAHRRAQHPHSQSARHEGHDRGARQVPHQHLSGREHAVQRARQPARLRQARFLRPGHLQRRRHGGAGGRRQEVARHHRLPDRRGLWPQRDLGRRHLQSHRLGGLHRHDRPAAAQRRDQDPRRPGQGGARWARPARSPSRARRSCRATGSGRTRRRWS